MAEIRGPVAVLCSGGLDSAVLLVEMARLAGDAAPLFVRAGHVWEEAERAALARFVAAAGDRGIRPIRDLVVPVADIYGAHWSMTGSGVPTWDAPDEAVELRGRNLILLAKALVLAAIEGWPTVALGTLAGNPFPDATPAFFAAMAKAAGTAVGMDLRIVTPLLKWKKHEVIREGWNLPLEYSFSCMNPVGGMHCGNCNKCFERKTAFAAAGVPDKTTYAGEV